ncbi:alpha/beta fold hydrolase [Aggregatibacter kilianii]|uniref:alpha/beta fold hydrolase n=1 Tax=Aggregatibacter kilianii TaxID=2025884 RepID=UPI000D65E9B3|nr:alpha/beta hydrolase [Aggregatibacter kilianii]
MHNAALLQFAAQFPLQYIQGERGCRLAYRHFTHHPVARKLVIMVNGRAENILKWTEIAQDFYTQGYDVLLFDHRGQGYSQRLLKDPEKGYLDEFRFYVQDMAKIIENLTALYPYPQQYLLAHSLGGLVSAYYLANFDHRIERAVFSAPFFGVPLKKPTRDELLLNLMMLWGQGERYVFGKSAYKPVDAEHNDLSHSVARMQWMNEVNRENPQLRLGGPTFRWVHLCLTAIKNLPKVLPRIETPVLLLEAEQEKIVNNKTLKKLTALLPHGERRKVRGAKHEILFEIDDIRQPALQWIYDFLNPDKPA